MRSDARLNLSRRGVRIGKFGGPHAKNAPLNCPKPTPETTPKLGVPANPPAPKTRPTFSTAGVGFGGTPALCLC
jgi:hypothetical protein